MGLGLFDQDVIFQKIGRMYHGSFPNTNSMLGYTQVFPLLHEIPVSGTVRQKFDLFSNTLFACRSTTTNLQIFQSTVLLLQKMKVNG